MGFEEGGDWRDIGGVGNDAVAEQESGARHGASSTSIREHISRLEKAY